MYLSTSPLPPVRLYICRLYDPTTLFNKKKRKIHNFQLHTDSRVLLSPLLTLNTSLMKNVDGHDPESFPSRSLPGSSLGPQLTGWQNRMGVDSSKGLVSWKPRFWTRLNLLNQRDRASNNRHEGTSNFVGCLENKNHNSKSWTPIPSHLPIKSSLIPLVLWKTCGVVGRRKSDVSMVSTQYVRLKLRVSLHYFSLRPSVCIKFLIWVCPMSSLFFLLLF